MFLVYQEAVSRQASLTDTALFAMVLTANVDASACKYAVEAPIDILEQPVFPSAQYPEVEK